MDSSENYCKLTKNKKHAFGVPRKGLKTEVNYILRMSGCQFIKDNDKACRNYARNGMKCCYAHRKHENSEPRKVVIVEKPPKVIGHQCCCLNLRERPCPIEAFDRIDDEWHCWRHRREFNIKYLENELD